MVKPVGGTCTSIASALLEDASKYNVDITSRTPGHTPSLTPFKEPAGPWVNKETYYLFSLSPAAVGAPGKLCLNFLSDL